MAAVQAEDVRAYFLFVGGLNSHHQECMVGFYDHEPSWSCLWLRNCLGCDQLVVGPTHALGGTLDLMTDVPDLVRVAVVAPIGNSDHTYLSAVISMAQAVPNLCVSKKVFSKHQVNWNIDCGEIRDLPFITFGSLIILLRFWTNICPCWFDVMSNQVHPCAWANTDKPYMLYFFPFSLSTFHWLVHFCCYHLQLSVEAWFPYLFVILNEFFSVCERIEKNF